MRKCLMPFGLFVTLLFGSCQKEQPVDDLISKQELKKESKNAFSTFKFDNSTNIVAIDWSLENQKFYYWSTQGIAIFGDFNDTDPPGSRSYSFTTPPGKIPSDIVEIAIWAPPGTGVNRIYAYYYDGRVSSGISNDLDSYASPTQYLCPAGYQPSNIVGMAVDSNGKLFTWWNDGKVSVGRTPTMTNLYNLTAPRPYTLPPGKTYSQIIAISIDRAKGNRVYTHYVDGTVSQGNWTDLDANAAPVPFD